MRERSGRRHAGGVKSLLNCLISASSAPAASCSWVIISMGFATVPKHPCGLLPPVASARSRFAM